MSKPLHRLPNGTWIDPYTITELIPCDATMCGNTRIPPRLVIRTARGNIMVETQDALHAASLADELGAIRNGVPVETRSDTPETRAEDEAADRELAEELAASDPREIADFVDL